jgi:hypothetical protein
MQHLDLFLTFCIVHIKHLQYTSETLETYVCNIRFQHNLDEVVNWCSEDGHGRRMEATAAGRTSCAGQRGGNHGRRMGGAHGWQDKFGWIRGAVEAYHGTSPSEQAARWRRPSHAERVTAGGGATWVGPCGVGTGWASHPEGRYRKRTSTTSSRINFAIQEKRPTGCSSILQDSNITASYSHMIILQSTRGRCEVV